MHIPDAYLSPATEAVAYAAMVPLWALAARRTSRDLTSRQVPLLSVGAAFCFAIQMFNIPAVGGTTAHALGASLLAILVGPWSALLGMSLTLAVQALLFGDGGILSLGANCFNMAFVACFVSHGVFRLLADGSGFGTSRGLASAAVGAYVGSVVASLSAGIFLGIQPTVAHDALGHALYCPFGLNVTIPAMTISHLLVAAPAEAMITVAALAYLWRAFPEMLNTQVRPKVGMTPRLIRRFGWILALTPLGLIAAGSAWGEWGASELKDLVGYTPAGIERTPEVVRPLLPDYGFVGFSGKPWEVAGYLVSALIGCGIVALFTRSILRRPKAEVAISLPLRPAGATLPDWMREPNPPLSPAKKVKTPWFEATLLKMRATVAKTIGSETVARSSGLLQSIHPTAKAMGFLFALVGVGFATNAFLLLAALGLAFLLAAFSNVPLPPFGARVAGAVAFFGLILAIPISLQAVTSGPEAFRIGQIAFSTTGLHSAATILLRLAAGISLAQLWTLTTPWHQLLRSLSSMGVPRMVLASATLTYRYLFMVMETLGDMVEARTARQVGACDKRQARTYAGTGSAVLFAKSFTLAEETHLAMQARGFDGTIHHAKTARWSITDSMFALAGAALLAMGVIHAF